MEKIIEKAQKIIDSYKQLPPDVITESMVNEIASLIVDYVILHGDHISDFDFDNLFKELELPQE